MGTSEKTLQRTALTIVCLGAFITPLMLSAVNVAIPTIAQGLKMDAITASWVPLAYLLSSGVFLLPFGRLGDMYGRKRMFLSGMTTVTVASILASFAPSPLVLILCRALQGMGAAMLFGTGIAILSSVYPPEKRGKVLGLSVSSVYLGLTCGPFAGGWVTQQFGWRSVFVFHIPVVLLVIILGLINLKGEWRGPEGQKFDIPGALIYGAAVIALMYGFSILPALSGFALILLSGIGFAVFFRYEKGLQYPLFNVNLFSGNPVLTWSCVAALIMYSSTFSVTFLMSLYLQNIREFTPQLAGLIMISQPLVMTLFSPVAGRMSDHYEPRLIASSGMGLTAIGLAMLAVAGPLTQTELIVLTLMLVGFGFSLFSSPNTNAILSSVDKKYLGAASGTVATMRVIGQMFSMGIVTLVFALMLGPVQFSPEQHGQLLASINASFIVASALCFIGVYFSLKRGNLRAD
ncbi:MAG: MFS transporter [Gammaproteobacteria bacterium]|nr:MFS transporter [Gammaproteobacteria bacterium]